MAKEKGKKDVQEKEVEKEIKKNDIGEKMIDPEQFDKPRSAGE
jgi:hypothetical protein